MNWKDVGDWLSQNAGTGAALVGSLLTGNVPGAVAAGVSLVTSATGEGTPDKVLQSLQSDPTTVVKLRELAINEEASIREHIRSMAELEAKERMAEHEQTQTTIREGDKSEDEYVRHTRPLMARQSWYFTAGYIIAFEALKAAKVFSFGASIDLAMLLGTPAAVYLGLRSVDKWPFSKGK